MAYSDFTLETAVKTLISSAIKSSVSSQAWWSKRHKFL